MARTDSAPDWAAEDREVMAADEVHIVVIVEGYSGFRVGRRYLAPLIAILALLATVVVLARATGNATHVGSHRMVGTLVPASFAADSAYWPRLALEEARERGPDPDNETR